MPLIAVTMGDPSGIGPEIVLKSLIRNPELRRQVIVVGNTRALERAASGMHIEEIPDDIKVSDVDGPLSPIGKTGPESGNIAIKSIETASKMALNSDVIGICTAPINKESIKMVGSSFIDHTDMLKSLTGSEWISTVFESGTLRIFFLTKHLSLMKALKSLNIEMIEQGLEEAQISMNLIGIERPRIAIAAINPHAGENGILGIEEKSIITPAIVKMKSRINVEGPFPADSVYYRASKGEFDLVVSPYHDQGHIAAKMLDFHGTVSMNLGLPYLRTSVDHGTAFDIAGRGIANEESMTVAIRKCLQLSEIYRENYSRIFGGTS